MKKLAIVAALFANTLLGCAAESEDVDGDVFGQTEDGKGDSGIVAGVSENTFDGYAVLNAAASLDAAGWIRETGISSSKAAKLVAAQEDGGLGRVGLPSLKKLVQVGGLSMP